MTYMFSFKNCIVKHIFPQNLKDTDATYPYIKYKPYTADCYARLR